MKGNLVFVHGLTPIHTGTGQSADVIDLPVAREKTTNWPYLPGSSIKGVLRDAWGEKQDGLSEAEMSQVFGPETITDNNGSAGCVVFSDAKLLCLAVRSYYGTFCWVTCPSALTRLSRDAAMVGNGSFGPCSLSLTGEQVIVTTGSSVSHDMQNGKKVYLEDYDVADDTGHLADNEATSIANAVFITPAEQSYFVNHFAIVSDGLFTLLAETATEVVARIKIKDETKTVQTGGLWYEEAVPSESIFWSPMLLASRKGISVESLDQLVARGWTEYVQIGGNATVGRGIVRLVRCLEAR